MCSLGKGSRQFLRRNSAVPDIIVAAWAKSRDRKAQGQEHEEQSFEAIGTARPIHLAGLHPARSDRQCEDGLQIYKEIFGSDRFRKLAARGARVRRLLWASTGTKNPDYSDVKYVEALIGPDTVDPAPLETLDAYRDHGEPKARLEQDVEQARWVLERLPELGIRIDNVTRQLEDEGVEKFNKPFDKLMETVTQRSPRHLTRES